MSTSLPHDDEDDDDNNDGSELNDSSRGGASSAAPSFRSMPMVMEQRVRSVPHEAAVVSTTVSQLQQPTAKDSYKQTNQQHGEQLSPSQKQQLYQQQQQQQQQGRSVSMAATATAPPGWKSPQLTRLGMFHPLEASHTSFARTLLPIMLQLLVELFQTMSLSTVYHDSPSPLSVSCESMEQVQFEVCFWESRKQPNDVVIMEIQKVAGDTMYFQHYAQQILASVAAAAAVAAKAAASSSPIITQCPPVAAPYAGKAGTTLTSDAAAPVDVAVGWDVPAVMAADRVWRDHSNRDTTASTNTTTTEEALEILYNVLFSGRYDACRLGLESACIMTDPTKTGWSTACVVAQALLAPTNPMQKQISSYILQWVFRDGGDGVDADTNNWYANELSYFALQALAQALQVAVEAQAVAVPPGTAAASSSSSGLASTFLEVTCGGHHHLDLVALLLNKVRTVQQYPHTAYYAIRALTALCQAVPQVSQRIAHQDVEYAQQVGVATHAALATVSGRLLVTLQAC